MKPKYFKIEELVPEGLFLAYKNRQDLLWNLFDDRVLIVADWLRVHFGKMICNDWLWEGNNHYRGFRPFNSVVGAELSQHKFGRALDLVPVEIEVELVRRFIRRKRSDVAELQYITCIEDNKSWLHFDVRNPKSPERELLIIC